MLAFDSSTPHLGTELVALNVDWEWHLAISTTETNSRSTPRLESRLFPNPIGTNPTRRFVQTEVFATPRDAITGFRIRFEYTAEAFRSQHHESLQRLGLARVNSLTIHDIDFGYHNADQIEEHLHQLDRSGGGGAERLEDLRKRGLIDAIGCGCNLEARNAHSWDDDAHEKLCERIADLVDLDFFVVAGAYTLLETRALRRIIPMCRERGIGIVAATPFAGGWLADPERATTYMYGSASDTIRGKTKRIQRVCKQYDVPLPAAALQFQLACPLVAAVIPGAKSPEEVTGNYRLANQEIPDSFWSDLKRLRLLDPNADVPNQA